MGGHGGLNILPQKSWNVYSRKNREIVARDEAEAARAAADAELAEAAEQAQRRLREMRSRDAGAEGADADERRQPGDTHAHVNLFSHLEAAERASERDAARKREEARAIARIMPDLDLSKSAREPAPWYARAPTARSSEEPSDWSMVDAAVAAATSAPPPPIVHSNERSKRRDEGGSIRAGHGEHKRRRKSDDGGNESESGTSDSGRGVADGSVADGSHRRHRRREKHDKHDKRKKRGRHEKREKHERRDRHERRDKHDWHDASGRSPPRLDDGELVRLRQQRLARERHEQARLSGSIEGAGGGGAQATASVAYRAGAALSAVGAPSRQSVGGATVDAPHTSSGHESADAILLRQRFMELTGQCVSLRPKMPGGRPHSARNSSSSATWR